MARSICSSSGEVEENQLAILDCKHTRDTRFKLRGYQDSAEGIEDETQLQAARRD